MIRLFISFITLTVANLILICLITGCTSQTISPVSKSDVEETKPLFYTEVSDSEHQTPTMIKYEITTESNKYWEDMLLPRLAEYKPLIEDLKIPEKLDYYFDECVETKGKYQLAINYLTSKPYELPRIRTGLVCKYDPLKSRYDLAVEYHYRADNLYNTLYSDSINISKVGNKIKIFVVSGMKLASTLEESQRYAYGIKICENIKNKTQQNLKIKNILDNFRTIEYKQKNSYFEGTCSGSYSSGCLTYSESYGVRGIYNAKITVYSCHGGSTMDDFNYVPVKIVN